MTKKKSIKQILQSCQNTNPPQSTKEFKKLQLDWYKKLERTGFKDIERTGTLKNKYFSEDSPYLWRQSFEVRNLILKHPNTFEYFHNLRKISWDAIVLPNSTLNQSNSAVSLSTIDSKVLYRFADGHNAKQISNYLRKYFPCEQKPNQPGPKGKLYSSYWVHYRIKKLLKAIQSGEIMEAHEYEKLNDLLDNNALSNSLQDYKELDGEQPSSSDSNDLQVQKSTSNIVEAQTSNNSNDLTGGGVKKTGFDEVHCSIKKRE